MKWFEADRQALEMGRAVDPVLARTIDLALAQLAGGIELGHPRWNEQWEVLMGLAAAQTENCLRCAWYAAFAFYPVQALAMSRLAYEHIAILAYVPTHREEAVLWFTSERAPRRAGDMWATVFADRPDFSADARELRRMLDEASHQNPAGLGALIEALDADHLVFWSASKPDALYLRYAGGLVARMTGLALHVILTWKRGIDTGWTKDTVDVLRALRAWIALNDAEISPLLRTRR